MLTQIEKSDFLEELRSLVESDFTSADVCDFVRNNETAQYLLRKVSFCEYEKELDFINDHDEYEVTYMLNTPHEEFYDSDFGSLDSLMGFRINKRDYEQDEDDASGLTFENLEEYDNVLSHMLMVLKDEDTEIPLSEVLSSDNLAKLLDGGYDCQANQIYYFEQKGIDRFVFYHYYRIDNGWDCDEYKMDLTNYPEFARLYFDDCNCATDVECHFYYDIENAYREYLDTWTEDLPFIKAVFNGEAAIRQLKDSTYRRIHFLAKLHQEEIRAKEKAERYNVASQLFECTKVLDLFHIEPQVLAYQVINAPQDYPDSYSRRLTIDSIIQANKILEEKDNEIEKLRNEIQAIRNVLFTDGRTEK